MAGRSGAIDMTRGRPISLMLRFALPMMLGSVFQSLYTMVDSAVLGRYVGSEALAARRRDDLDDEFHPAALNRRDERRLDRDLPSSSARATRKKSAPDSSARFT